MDQIKLYFQFFVVFSCLSAELIGYTIASCTLALMSSVCVRNLNYRAIRGAELPNILRKMTAKMAPFLFVKVTVKVTNKCQVSGFVVYNHCCILSTHLTA